MAKKPILVVMAAGMGSRYGGLKQIDPVGSHGETLLDYSLYDAYRAGFETAIIIIREAIRQDFMELVAPRLEKSPMEIRYACQEQHMLPEGFFVPEIRGAKPWGTSHAVLCAAEAIGDAPFVVLNSDDYYGAGAFRAAYDWLSKNHDPFSYCMVGYQVGRTVSDSGAVTRGLCEYNDQGYLTKIVECKGIEKYEGGIRLPKRDGTWFDLMPDYPVSMNMWGFQNDFLDRLRLRFPVFLSGPARMDPARAEFLLPTTVGQMVADGLCSVKVLTTPDQWYGVTYAADKPMVVAALQRMTDEGLYPAEGLWN